MSVKRLPKTDEFVAIDEIGNCVLIIEYTEMIGVVTESDEPAEQAGVKHYLTAANEQVLVKRDGSYVISGKDVLLRRLE